MSVTESLLPRHVLFNAALYAGAALIYSVVIFALETSSPGEYVFFDSDESKWRSIFNNIAIVSWPILLFGALILLAVRVGANVRRRRRKRSKKKKRSSSKNSLSERNTSDNSLEAPPLPPSTTPPPVPLRTESAHRGHSPQPMYLTSDKVDEEDPPIVRAKSSRKVKRCKSTFHVPRGYVSVNRPQRMYAAFGFLWVAVGLGLTAAAAAIVFVGQRERFQQVANSLGNQQEDWKTWIIPICTGGILVLVFGTLAITTFIKFLSTLSARPSLQVRNTTASEGSVREVEDLDLLYKTGKELPDDDLDDAKLPAVPPRAALSRNKGMIDATILPNIPEQSTIDRLMRQLRDMGFKNPDQNMAALQASSFDLEKASEKLANTAT